MTALTLKYNDRYREVFNALGFKEVTKDTLNKAFKVYSKVLAGMKVENIKSDTQYLPLKPVTRRSVAQKRAAILNKDRMQTAKQDMINHITDLIESGEISYTELMADPTVYFDSQIMGNYYNNTIIRKSIVKYFDVSYIPF
jgi:hypothetical protein